MKKIRVGVLGIGRGLSFAKGAKLVGMELVALCDTWEEKLLEVGKELRVATYTDYDKFLEHEMDAVILANYFHQHVPFAIKALDAGLHVMSETIACGTIGEGVALARAVEKSGKIYMLAENYAYFVYNQEMRRLYQKGEIGEVQYAEGEYQHSMNARGFNELGPGINHWRNHLPPTYYCSHALSPLMYVTDTRPVSANAQSIIQSNQDKEKLHVKVSDLGFVTVCRMDNDSVARLMGLMIRGDSIWYRFHGTRGLMENLRTGNRNMVRIIHEEWDRLEGDVAEKIYLPDFPIYDKEAKSTGHSGGDFFMNYHFSEAIRKNEQPYFDVYRGLDMALVGIQGWRSCLANGAPFDIPDFRNEEIRKAYENDFWSPFPDGPNPRQAYPSIKGELHPSAEAIAYAKQIWADLGYKQD